MGRRARVRAGFLPVGATGNCGRRGAPPDEGEAVPRPYIVSQRRGDPLGRPVVRADALVRARNKQIARRAWEIVGGAGRRRMRARQCLAPTSPLVVHADALVRARNKQIARRAWEIVGGAGRRRMRARRCLAPTLCPNVGATHWVALVVHADALVRAPNKQIARRAWEIVGGAGRRRMRARQCLAPLCPNVHWCSPDALVRAPNKQIARRAWEIVGGAGRRRMRARQCLAPTLCPNVGATHWVALGRSRRRARSCSEQTNREAGLGNCGRRGAPPDEGEAVPRPYDVCSTSNSGVDEALLPALGSLDKRMDDS